MSKVPFNLEEQVVRVVESLKDDVEGMSRYYLMGLDRVCESPIEAALGATILMKDKIDTFAKGFQILLCNNNDIESYRDTVWLLVPQYEWNGYRIDFALRAPWFRFKWIFIECDGHNFHERTKEQAARDRAKDRDIQSAGIPILRFTGSEIHRDLSGCGEQVFSFLEDRQADWIPLHERPD